MSIRRRLVFTIALLALCGGDAFAGVVVTTTGTNFKTNTPIQVIVYADADKLKIVTEFFSVIYRGDLQKYWTISPTLMTYSELTPELLKQVGERRTAAQTAQQQRIAKMTPQQQQEYQAQMSKLGVPQNAGASSAQTGKAVYTKPAGRPRRSPIFLASCTARRSAARGLKMCASHVSAQRV